MPFTEAKESTHDRDKEKGTLACLRRHLMHLTLSHYNLITRKLQHLQLYPSLAVAFRYFHESESILLRSFCYNVLTSSSPSIRLEREEQARKRRRE